MRNVEVQFDSSGIADEDRFAVRFVLKGNLLRLRDEVAGQKRSQKSARGYETLAVPHKVKPICPPPFIPGKAPGSVRRIPPRIIQVSAPDVNVIESVQRLTRSDRPRQNNSRAL